MQSGGSNSSSNSSSGGSNVVVVVVVRWTPEEPRIDQRTKLKITEYETKVQYCKEITGTPLDAKHKKSILWGLLDKETRAAVVQWQGRDDK